MFVFGLLVVLVASVNGAILPQGRIIGGQPVDITEVPHTAAVLVDVSNNGNFGLYCGGAIISKKTILTAAQCVNRYSAVRIRVRVGSTNYNSGGKLKALDAFKVHEKYNSNTLDNDIALLYLFTDVEIGDSVKTVALPAFNAPIVEGSGTYFSGWGSTTLGGSPSVSLRKMTVPVVKQEVCVSAYSGINAVTSNMFCAGILGQGGIDACSGDTGGPLLIGALVYGLSSWGYSCATPQYPGVYTRIPVYRTWIDQNVK